MIKVVLVDDHTLILRGLRELLSSTPGIEVIGEATDYGSLRTLIRQVRPDVIVLDINLPGRSGLDALASLLEEDPAPRVLMLSQFAADQYGIRALRPGAMGYLNKSCDPALIADAVHEPRAGRRSAGAEGGAGDGGERPQGLERNVQDERNKQRHGRCRHVRVSTVLKRSGSM